MRIGIDIDGVLTEYEQFMLDYGTKYCYESKIPIEVKVNTYSELEAFGITQEQADKFWEEYLITYLKKYPIRTFAVDIIRKLKEEGNEIYIVTARNEYGLPKECIGMMSQLTENWLNTNGVIYDKIFYTRESKLKTIIDNEIDIMIDDAPNNTIEISTKIPVLCYNSQYNVGIEGKNITRVYSWYDIYEKIKEVSKPKD